MAKAPTVTAIMGVALLAAINTAAQAAPGYLFISQEQAASVDASHIQVNSAVVEGDKAAAILTDAGRAFLASQGAPAAPASAPTSFEIEDGIAIPPRQRGAGNKTGYPFDQLGVGQSFHVAKTAENPTPAERLASSVTGARAKYSEPMKDAAGQAVMEQVTVKSYAKGADGKFLKDAEGKRIVAGESQVMRQKTVQIREFAVATVPASDPKGEGARVWRTK